MGGTAEDVFRPIRDKWHLFLIFIVSFVPRKLLPSTASQAFELARVATSLLREAK